MNMTEQSLSKFVQDYAKAGFVKWQVRKIKEQTVQLQYVQNAAKEVEMNAHVIYTANRIVGIDQDYEQQALETSTYMLSAYKTLLCRALRKRALVLQTNAKRKSKKLFDNKALCWEQLHEAYAREFGKKPSRQTKKVINEMLMQIDI